MGVPLTGKPYMQTSGLKGCLVKAYTKQLDSLRLLTLKIYNLLGARRVFALYSGMVIC
jgi:hypothetical protein